MRAVVSRSSEELANRVRVADSFFARLKGLLGVATLTNGEALWIRPCTGVHTFGMRFPIDVLFLDRQYSVVEIVQNLPPYRLTPFYRTAASVLELPAGKVTEIIVVIGDHIDFQ